MGIMTLDELFLMAYDTRLHIADTNSPKSGYPVKQEA